MKCLVLDFIAQRYRAKIVGVEVPFLSGRRWADLLVITESGKLIAFEIKSDRDSLRRMANQIEDYIRTFDQVHLILSEKFRKSPLLKSLPRSIGYGFIDSKKRRVDYVRPPRARSRLSKENLLYFLWRKDLSAHEKSKQEPTEDVRRRMGRALSMSRIKKLAREALVRRYAGRYRVFLREKSSRVHVEDLLCLTKASVNTF